MWRTSSYVLICFLFHNVVGLSQLCGKNVTTSCTSEILGQDDMDPSHCEMIYYASDSKDCDAMDFGNLAPNTYIGGVTLKPYIMEMVYNIGPYPVVINYTVLNITFSNIKWTNMKFRFIDKFKDMKNHCRKINISKDAMITDQSVLFYDCYWAKTDNTDGQSHTLDFEASSDNTVNRGQYYFNVPSAEMLSPTVTEETWKPFIYIEFSPSIVRLHIMPPPKHLKITDYYVKLMKESKGDDYEIKAAKIRGRNDTDEILSDYKILGVNGSYHFEVRVLYDGCENELGCNVVKSPTFAITNDAQALNICIASVTALIVAALFAYYIALRVIRKYWCRDYRRAMDNDIPPPTKVLVIYSSANRLHAECVASFVTYLRSEYGFDLMYDRDISCTSHGDPYIWAEEAFRLASHVMYIVSPTEETNLYNSIYDKPIITAHKDVDLLLLSFVKSSRVSRCPKDVLNVFFEHSNGPLPIETRHDRVFFLLKDWQKLISYLSKNLLPKRHIMRTEGGRCFLDDLKRAKKMLSDVKKDDVIVTCDKMNAFEKKILL